MLSRGRSIYLVVLFAFGINLQNAGAFGFYPIYEDAAQPRMYAASLGGNGLESIYAVGENGAFIHSANSGYDWNSVPTGVDVPLLSIASKYDYTNSNEISIAVGENGAVGRFDNNNQEWLWTNIGSATFYGATYSGLNGEFWIGGANGRLYHSNDLGQNWVREFIDSTLTIRSIQSSYDGTILVAQRSDSIFILRGYEANGFFLSQPGDTIPGLNFVDATMIMGGESQDQILVTGTETASGQTAIWIASTWTQGPVSQLMFRGNLGTVSSIGYYGYMDFAIWVATEQGTMWVADWNSNNFPSLPLKQENWRRAYSDAEGRSLGPMVITGFEEDPGRVLGAGGLVLKYGFEMEAHYPNSAVRNYTSAFDHLELDFTVIPDLASLEKETTVLSSQRGYLPLTAAYDAGDSTKAILSFNTDFGDVQIPGERLNISFSDSLHALGDNSGRRFNGFNYDLTLVSPFSTSFRFNSLFKSAGLNSQTTNWVTGFINDDDTLDLLTFASDTIFCYVGADSGNYQHLEKIPMPNTINFDNTKKEQIILHDINRDGRPDLILYDNSEIFFVMNQSVGNQVLFSGPTAQWSDEILYRVYPYNENNNQLADLLILGLGFTSRYDIREDSFGSSYHDHEYGAVSHRDAQIADINGDDIPDMVIIDNDGQLVLRPGTGYGYYDAYSQVIPAGGRTYSGFKIADLDGDNTLEVLAYNSSYIDLISFDRNTQINGWGFNPVQQNVVDTRQVPIQDFCVQDFGGNRDYSDDYRLDLIVLTPDSVLFYENQNSQYQSYIFNKLPQYSFPTDVAYDFLVAGDFDKNGALDFGAFDNTSGQFELWYKFNWRPALSQPVIANHRIELSWTPFPTEGGKLQYYRLIRDHQPQFGPGSYIRNINKDTFIDEETEPYVEYWYAVQAVYEGGIQTEWSEPVSAQTFFELNGAQSGAITDTTRPYLVRSPISVPDGESLLIGPGISIAFEPETRFDIYGNLQVAGSDVDQEMVQFHSFDWDSTMWDGIVLHQAADTVDFKWFSIYGAKTAIQNNGRPLHMQYGDFVGNDIALASVSDTVRMQNVIFDSNRVALQLELSAMVDISNTNIMHSLNNSIVVNDNALAKIKNAIVWDNPGPMQRNSETAAIQIGWSTVDVLADFVQANEVRSLPPVFMSEVDGFYYLPDISSPTIDAGDPADDYSAEPLPNGGRINQGVFGGTMFATPSYQPRLKANPLSAFIELRPGQRDTIDVQFQNPGGSPLHIFNAGLVKEISAFSVVSPPVDQLASGDSMLVRIEFAPPLARDYQDTLRVFCDDPHLEAGHLDIILAGRGSDIVTVVKLDTLKKQLFRESAVRLWYSVVDSGSATSTPSVAGTYDVHWAWLNTTTGDTMTGVTSSPDHLDLQNLKDGIYLFKIWALDQPNAFVGDQHARFAHFSILVNKQSVPRFRWQMVSVPRPMQIDWQWFELGDSSAILLKWSEALQDYEPLKASEIKPGEAFWAFPLKKISLDLSQIDKYMQETKATSAFDSLQSGWNQVGSPRDYNVFWHQIRIYTFDGRELDYLSAMAEGVVDSAIYWYKHDNQFKGYEWTVVDSTTEAEPWHGYWIHTNQPCSIDFPWQPAFDLRNEKSVAKFSGLAKSSDQGGSWQVQIGFKNSQYTDAKNIVGITDHGTREITEPPQIGDYCALYLTSRRGRLTQKLYAPQPGAHLYRWHFTAESRSQENHTLFWDQNEAQNSGMYLFLVDEQQEQVVDMNSTGSYEFELRQGKSTFTVYASVDADFKPEIVPLKFKLQQNYPNPFNPQTTIRFGIPERANGNKVTLSIFNVLGEKVAVVFQGNLDRGYHEFIWNGRTRSGLQAASGVYFYRLQAGDVQIIKKMVLVR